MAFERSIVGFTPFEAERHGQRTMLRMISGDIAKRSHGVEVDGFTHHGFGPKAKSTRQSTTCFPKLIAGQAPFMALRQGLVIMLFLSSASVQPAMTISYLIDIYADNKVSYRTDYQTAARKG